MLKIIAVLLTFFTFSCSSIFYDKETGNLSYYRLGNQELKGLKVVKKTDGTFEIKLDSQSATDESLQEILKLVRKLAGPLP